MAGVGLFFLQGDTFDPAQAVVEALCNRAPAIIKRIEFLELYQSDRGLELAHAVIAAYFELVVIVIHVERRLRVPILVVSRLSIRADALVGPLVHLAGHVDGAQRLGKLEQVSAVGSQHAALAGGHVFQ